MLVGDAMSSERRGEDVAVELRVGPRARNGPHVDDELDFRTRQERRKLVDRAGGMSDSEERVGHAVRCVLRFLYRRPVIGASLRAKWSRACMNAGKAKSSPGPNPGEASCA